MSDDYQDSIADRNLDREDGQVKISTHHEEEISEKGFVQMFEQKVHKYRQMLNQASNLNAEIEQRLDDYEEEMSTMHVLDESQEQADTADVPNHPVDCLSEGAVTAYVEVQQYQSKKENLEDDLRDLKKDLQDLWPMVQKVVASNRDLEIPKATQSMEGVLDGVQKYFGDDGDGE